MRKILFLDIDGVLNSRQFQIRRVGQPQPEERPLWDLDPQAIGTLNKIVVPTGCEVILSSTWRKLWTLSDLNCWLQSLGFEGFVTGVTPVSPGWCERAGVERSQHERGLEIEWWLRENTDLQCAVAILDDDSDMSNLKHRWVHTPQIRGLQEQDVDKCLTLLNTSLEPMPESNPWLDVPPHQPNPIAWAEFKKLCDKRGL